MNTINKPAEALLKSLESEIKLGHYTGDKLGTLQDLLKRIRANTGSSSEKACLYEELAEFLMDDMDDIADKSIEMNEKLKELKEELALSEKASSKVNSVTKICAFVALGALGLAAALMASK